MQLTSSNFGSPNGPGSDLDGMGTRSGSTTDEKLVHFETKISQSPECCVKFITHSNQYRATCGDVLTQEKVKFRYKCFSGVSF